VSQENVEVVRRVLNAMVTAQARRRRDGSFPEQEIGAAFDLMAAEHELVPYMTSVEGKTSFRGEQGFREWIGHLEDAWESWDTRPEQLTVIDGERVLVAYRFRARSRLIGLPVDEQLAWVMTVCDGKLARTEAYPSVHEALKAVGLEE